LKNQILDVLKGGRSDIRHGVAYVNYMVYSDLVM